MKHCKSARYAPAFILLMLSFGPNHGLGILSKMDELVKGHRLDTAVIYRMLKKLESEKAIVSDWESSELGPKKKVYSITDKGKLDLKTYKTDIEDVIKNLQNFLELY